MKTIVIIILAILLNVAAEAQSTKETNALSGKVGTSHGQTAGGASSDSQTSVTQNGSGKETVAIYPFTSASGFDYTYAESVGNAVESGFVRSNRFMVVERSRFGSISSEERFKEVNTSMVVRNAAKFGARYIVTGHITGANTGKLYDSQNKFDGYQTNISVAFKVIDVVTSEIKVAESLNLSGRGGSTASAIGNAYAGIDGVTRRIIAAYFPQRFALMSILEKGNKKKTGDYLVSFKIWGGADQGLKVGDMVEVYKLSEVINPVTRQMVEEKTFAGVAEINAVNSGTTATCLVYRPNKYGAILLELMQSDPEHVAIEYAGSQKPRSFWDSL